MAARVRVAFDDSPQADAAFRPALATYSDAAIHVLHVPDPREWSGAGVDGGFSSDDASKPSQESAEPLLAEATAIAQEYDAEITTDTTVGNGSAAIGRDVEANDIEHVGLGSHGRRGLARVLLGTVADRVARRTPGSVTIIREPPADRET